MKSDVKKYLQKIGQKGGKSRSGPKLTAVALNLVRARQAKKAKKTARNAKLSDSSHTWEKVEYLGGYAIQEKAKESTNGGQNV